MNCLKAHLRPHEIAPVAKLVDAPGSDPDAERHRSSTLLWGTTTILS